MAIGYITIQEFTTSGTRTDDTLSFVSGGSSRGMLLLSIHASTATDRIPDGNVTYAGTNMPRFDRAVDSSGEPGAVYGFFLGSGVTQGDQDCVVTYNASNATTIVHYLIQLSGAADLEVITSSKVEGDAENPSATPAKGGVSAFAFGILFSGHDAVTSHAPVTGLTEPQTCDFGSQTGSVVYETSGPSTSDQAVGWTATSEDVALLAVVIREAAAALSRLALLGAG